MGVYVKLRVSVSHLAVMVRVRGWAMYFVAQLKKKKKNMRGSGAGIQRAFLKSFKKEGLYLPSILCFLTSLSHLHPHLPLLSTSSSRNWYTSQLMSFKKFSVSLPVLYELTCYKCVCVGGGWVCVCASVCDLLTGLKEKLIIHCVIIHTQYVWWSIRCLTHASLLSACVWVCVWFTWLTEIYKKKVLM